MVDWIWIPISIIGGGCLGFFVAAIIRSGE